MTHKKIPVGILGACGLIGQRYISLLADHPWFVIGFLGARHSFQTYQEAIQGKWILDSSLPENVKNLPVHSIDALEEHSIRLVFSGLPGNIAKHCEEKAASYGMGVISSSSMHRKEPDVPLLIPEVNAAHLAVIAIQRKLRGWDKGFLIAKPNCSIQSYLIPLAPLHKIFGLEKVSVTTLQALSGGGSDLLKNQNFEKNVIPYIPEEEEKSESEPLKILGSVGKQGIENNLSLKISSHCTRIPVIDGHLAMVSVKLKKTCSLEEIRQVWDSCKPLNLPTAPKQTIIYHMEKTRPQPLKDSLEDNGMAISVGRLRPCPLFDFRFCALSHNTIRGGAGGGLLIAELLKTKGMV